MPKVIKEKNATTTPSAKRKHAIHDKLDKTQDFIVADGIVSFTCTFRYLGSQISYNLPLQPQTHLWVHSRKYGAIPTSTLTASTYYLSNTNEPPPPLGLRDLVLTIILTGQTRSLPTQKHSSHPENIHVSGQVHGEDKKRRSTYHLLCNALCQEHNCSMTA
jgi:hypothetical protein